MSHNEKRFFTNSVVIPMIIAFVAASMFFIALNILSDEFPFTLNMTYASDFEHSEVLRTDKQIMSGDTVSKSDITPPSDNLLVGSIDANGKSLELIYDANAVNAIGRFNIMSDSKYIGEVGAAFAQCYKSDSDFIKQLTEGDIVKVNTYYGDFVYEVTDISICDSVLEVKKQGDGIGRALVLYSDCSDGVGISDSITAAVCQMTGGYKVTE
ncbi:MAG: hypothetical protein K2H13_10225 [Eubacterium sp.]|nr:hypothetical protein [Eubacterium sp.]MDE6156313.1 hypothetical protein [Eubacterium sp.]MDE6766618.1 hypothetical protein [Eubacterium sp.]